LLLLSFHSDNRHLSVFFLFFCVLFFIIIIIVILFRFVERERNFVISFTGCTRFNWTFYLTILELIIEIWFSFFLSFCQLGKSKENNETKIQMSDPSRTVSSHPTDSALTNSLYGKICFIILLLFIFRIHWGVHG